MRYPDLRNVTIDGVPFVDAGASAQSRYIGALQDEHHRKEAETDPAALTKAERECLDAGVARLAEAQAAYDSAVQRWADLRFHGWHGQPMTTTVNGKVTQSIPSEADVASAEQAKVAAERVLQQALISRTKEGQEVNAARWWRRHEAERGASAKRR